MKIKICILSLSLLTAGVLVADTDETPWEWSVDNIPAKEFGVKRGRLSTACLKTRNRLSNHKGKVCLAAGAIGATIVNKVFAYEIDNYVKPFIKGVFKRTYNFFKRIFKGGEPEIGI